MTITPLTLINVLLIDDEAFMRQLMQRILQEIGVREIVAVENGQQGLERIRTSELRFDVVICDLEMPIMSGSEFLRTLRLEPDDYNSQLPVIILTGHGRPETVIETVHLGIHDFLVKPVSRQLLELRIEKVLSAPMINRDRLQIS